MLHQEDDICIGNELHIEEIVNRVIAPTLLKELGINPKTKKLVNVFESKSGRYLKKGFKRISIPDQVKTEDITIEVAVQLLAQG